MTYEGLRQLFSMAGLVRGNGSMITSNDCVHDNETLAVYLGPVSLRVKLNQGSRGFVFLAEKSVGSALARQTPRSQTTARIHLGFLQSTIF